MKLIFASLLLLLTTAAFAADTASAAGKWQVHLAIAGREYDSNCTFNQKDAELSGTCLSDQNDSLAVTGKVDGNAISWSYKTDYNGTEITVNHEGTMEADKITGKVTVPEFSAEGEFTATRPTEEKEPKK